MKFWDASALVPLLVQEPLTVELQLLYAGDPTMVVWWGTEIEAASAVARLERMGLPREEGAVALARLDLLRSRWQEVPPVRVVRSRARLLLPQHSLRAGDALQLAAAIIVAGPEGSQFEMVCLDDRLAEAARAEGFAVIDQATFKSRDPGESAAP